MYWLILGRAPEAPCPVISVLWQGRHVHWLEMCHPSPSSSPFSDTSDAAALLWRRQDHARTPPPPFLYCTYERDIEREGYSDRQRDRHRVETDETGRRLVEIKNNMKRFFGTKSFGMVRVLVLARTCRHRAVRSLLSRYQRHTPCADGPCSYHSVSYGDVCFSLGTARSGGEGTRGPGANQPQHNGRNVTHRKIRNGILDLV